MSSQTPHLVALSDGPHIPLDKPIVLIGRQQECDIQIESRKVSRKHCCIAQVDDHFVVRDLCSTNGIRINGTRVREGLLKFGDELTIGNLRYHLREAAAEAPAPVDGKTVYDDEQIDSGDEPIALAEPQTPSRRKAVVAAPAVCEGNA